MRRSASRSTRLNIGREPHVRLGSRCGRAARLRPAIPDLSFRQHGTTLSSKSPRLHIADEHTAFHSRNFESAVADSDAGVSCPHQGNETCITFPWGLTRYDIADDHLCQKEVFCCRSDAELVDAITLNRCFVIALDYKPFPRPATMDPPAGA